eukprot:Ihof_evm16s51 gene=Ihof_evmTU16s51
MPALLNIEPKDRLTFSVEVGGMMNPQVLKLTNSQSSVVFFKIKTTAPKKYCVRPNSGKVEPGAFVQVQIIVQNMKEEDLSSIPKDKFLVQTMMGPEDAETDTLFKGASKEEIKEEKLRCQLDQSNHEDAPSRDQGLPATTTTEKVINAKVERSAAEEESELARILKVNTQLKDQSAKLQNELRQAK